MNQELISGIKNALAVTLSVTVQQLGPAPNELGGIKPTRKSMNSLGIGYGALSRVMVMAHLSLIYMEFSC